MSEENEWRNLMQGVSEAEKGLEEAVHSMDRAVLECDRFIERARRRTGNQDVMEGLRVGLSFAAGVDWLRGAPTEIAGLIEKVVQHDDKVSVGELPATAHSWRYQIRERLAALEEHTHSLSRSFADRRAKLEKIAE